MLPYMSNAMGAIHAQQSAVTKISETPINQRSRRSRFSRCVRLFIQFGVGRLESAMRRFSIGHPAVASAVGHPAAAVASVGRGPADSAAPAAAVDSGLVHLAPESRLHHRDLVRRKRKALKARNGGKTRSAVRRDRSKSGIQAVSAGCTTTRMMTVRSRPRISTIRRRRRKITTKTDRKLEVRSQKLEVRG